MTTTLMSAARRYSNTRRPSRPSPHTMTSWSMALSIYAVFPQTSCAQALLGHALRSSASQAAPHASDSPDSSLKSGKRSATVRLSPCPLPPYNGQNGRRRQGLLLLSRHAVEVSAFHPGEPAQGAEPVVGMRRGGHGLRLVHSLSQAAAPASRVRRRNRVG